VCSTCPVGRFAEAVGSSECKPCDFGSIQPSVGQTSCVSCSAGQVTLDGNTCSSCPAGSIPNPTATTIDDEPCNECPRGFIAASGEETCTLCQIGTVANANRTVCEACPSSVGVTCSGAAMTLSSGYWIEPDTLVVEYDSLNDQVVRLPESATVHVCATTVAC